MIKFEGTTGFPLGGEDLFKNPLFLFPILNAPFSPTVLSKPLYIHPKTCYTEQKWKGAKQ